MRAVVKTHNNCRNFNVGSEFGYDIFGNLSALYVPNPAYLSALSLTAPLWIMVADKFLGVPDKVDSRWLAAMLLSICALIFFAQIPIAPPSDSPVSAGGHAPVAAK